MHTYEHTYTHAHMNTHINTPPHTYAQTYCMHPLHAPITCTHHYMHPLHTCAHIYTTNTHTVLKVRRWGVWVWWVDVMPCSAGWSSPLVQSESTNSVLTMWGCEGVIVWEYDSVIMCGCEVWLAQLCEGMWEYHKLWLLGAYILGACFLPGTHLLSTCALNRVHKGRQQIECVCVCVCVCVRSITSSSCFDKMFIHD